MIKTKKLVDNISPKDKININNVDLDEIIYYKKKAGVAKGVLDIINPETGEVVYTGHNKILASGAEFLARQMFDLPGSYSLLPSYNNILNLDNTVNSTVPGDTYKTCLFCVGNDGCGREASQVYEPDYKRIIDQNQIVPFQFRPLNSDIIPVLRDNVYQGRKVVSGSYGKAIAYYFKHFESDPVLHQIYTDGTPIDPNLYWDTTALPAITKVTMDMSITNTDCRDFFFRTVGLNEARINQLSLCLGWKKIINTHPVYQDIRPMTCVHFPNESLISLRKTILFRYSVYF